MVATGTPGSGLGGTGNDLTPTATGDFVLVPRHNGDGALSSSNGIGLGGEKKKGPPPVSKKPDNLRAASTDAVRKAG